MDSRIVVRPARVEDVPAMARMLVASWRETYRGAMPDRVLDDPGLVETRERFWTAALVEERYRANRVALAEREGIVIGVAMAGPPEVPAPEWSTHLYVLYVLESEHGTGAGAALLHAVIENDDESVALWVSDPNPRAQAFYRKHGFRADGAVQSVGGVRTIRMVRSRSGESG